MNDGNSGKRIAGILLGAFIMVGALLSSAAAADGKAPSAAQPPAKSTPDMTLTMRLYEGVIACPMPFWVKGVAQMGQNKLFRKQDKNLFTFEMIPKSQEFSHWRQLYGVYGFYLPKFTFKKFFTASLNALALGCKQKSQVHVFNAGGKAIGLEYYCPELRPELGLSETVREYGVLYISQTKNTFAKVYQAIRENANATKGNSLIMDAHVRNKLIESAKKIKFGPAE